MQPRTPPRVPASRIGDGRAARATVLGHHSQQLGGPRPGTTPDTRTDRPVIPTTGTLLSCPDSRSLASSHL